MVRGVSRGVEGRERPPAQIQRCAVAEDPEPIRRNGFHGAEQRGHAIRPIDAGGARDQPGWLGKVSGPAFVDPDGRPWERGGQRSDAPGVVEVDVRQDDVCKRVRADPERFERPRDRLTDVPGPVSTNAGSVAFNR